VGSQRHAPAALPLGKTRYLLYRRLGGHQDRSRRVRKISLPTGIRSPDLPERSESLYRLSRSPVTIIITVIYILLPFTFLCKAWGRCFCVETCSSLLTKYCYTINIAAFATNLNDVGPGVYQGGTHLVMSQRNRFCPTQRKMRNSRRGENSKPLLAESCHAVSEEKWITWKWHWNM